MASNSVCQQEALLCSVQGFYFLSSYWTFKCVHECWNDVHVWSFQNALKSAQDLSIADHLTAADRALLWLSYIHLTEFDRLPSSLYDPAESGPARLVSRESFLLPWRMPEDISTPPDILIAVFQGRKQLLILFRGSTATCYFNITRSKLSCVVVSCKMASISAARSLCLRARGRWRACRCTPT